jgi:hypothetical protein
VVVRSKVWTVFARSNAGNVCSNPIQGMDVCVRLVCVCAVVCVGSNLVTGWSPSKESYGLCIKLCNWKGGQGPKACTAIERERETFLSFAFPHISTFLLLSFLFDILLIVLHTRNFLLLLPWQVGSSGNVSDMYSGGIPIETRLRHRRPDRVPGSFHPLQTNCGAGLRTG